MKAQGLTAILFSMFLVSCGEPGVTLEDETLPSRIVHTKGRGIPYQVDLYVLERDGTDRRLVDSVGINNYATWSPDGTRIVFQGHRGKPTQIFVINADGTGELNISNSAEWDEVPIWAPDGSIILFESTRNNEADLWLVDPTGLSVANLTPFPLRDSQASWSPDSRKVAYAGRRSGNQEIYIADVGGRSDSNITNTPGQDEWVPYWSPDGQTIAFILNRQIWLAQSDGTARRQLTFL